MFISFERDFHLLSHYYNAAAAAWTENGVPAGRTQKEQLTYN